MLIDFIAGTKLDYYNIVPIIAAVQDAQDEGYDIGYRLIYIGQKTDFANTLLSLSKVTAPSLIIETSADSDAAITAEVAVQYEKILLSEPPDVTMLYGYSTGIMAAAITAAKIPDIRIAHIGAGTRNNNRNSISELNRRITDSITDYHFPISRSGSENLRAEGVSDDYSFLIGNPTADSLSNIDDKQQPAIWNELSLQQKRYILINVENPAITNSPARLKSLLLTISKISRNNPVILPVNSFNSEALGNISLKAPGLHLVNLWHLSGLHYLSKHARVVITDTEALQDETTILQTPCMTLFKSRSTPDSCETGTNMVTGVKPEALTDAFNLLYNGQWKKGQIPYLWDGEASNRIIAAIKNLQ